MPLMKEEYQIFLLCIYHKLYYRWDTVINKDIQEFFEKALKIYSENVSKLKGVMEQEDIVKKLYEFKLEAMMIFNQIFNFNQDTFNNSEYLARYNERKRNLEAEISKCESKVIDRNMSETYELCREILNNSYEIIQEKLKNKVYTSKTCDEYLKDHEK
jgi:hypothetical protein